MNRRPQLHQGVPPGARTGSWGKKYGVEYAEAFHYIPAGAAGADRNPIQKYINEHVVPK